MDKKIKDYLIKTVTKKEIKIVQELANDKYAGDVAEITGNSIRTVENIIYQLRKKFLCKNSYGLIVLFFREGLIK